jgi:MreB/Mbl protein
MLISRLAGLFSNDLAIDLGTANTLVYVRGQGVVMNEPSFVAIHVGDHSVLAVGHEAKVMLGQTPSNITAIRPLKDGVIADFDVTEKMLHYFINKVHQRRTLVHPRIVIGVPSGITQVGKAGGARLGRPGQSARGLFDRWDTGGGEAEFRHGPRGWAYSSKHFLGQIREIAAPVRDEEALLVLEDELREIGGEAGDQRRVQGISPSVVPRHPQTHAAASASRSRAYTAS